MRDVRKRRRQFPFSSFVRSKITCCIICLTVWGFSPAVASANNLLKFGVYTADKPTAVVQQFRPVLDAISKGMSEELGESVKIKLQVAKTYEAGIQDLVDGKADFSRFGPASYIEAKQMNPGISILAIESVKGKKQFSGIICVAKDSPIKSVADLKGKRFAFGNERSTIGRYLSQQYLLKHGIKASDLAYYEYLDRHDKVGTAVAMGKFDAGALKESTFKKLVAKGEPLRVIASFPNVTKPWLARSGLSEDLKKALQKTLLNLKDPAALKKLKKDGFLPGSDDDYNIIRSSMDNNDDFFK